MTITIMIEREGSGTVPKETVAELEFAALEALHGVVRGTGDFQARRIAVRIDRVEKRG